MPYQIVAKEIEAYTRALLARHDSEVALEMEELAREKGFPIVNRHVGVTLELLTRLAGAGRIFELGSGFGYSAYWFARGAPRDAQIHCTDGDVANRDLAEGFLGRAGVWDRITFHVGDAVTSFNEVPGDWDIVYCDIDKHGYPGAWRAARDRVRVGGLYICDNVLWGGRVTEDPPQDDVADGWTEAIVEHNTLIAADDRYLSSILPIRDGVVVALRTA